MTAVAGPVVAETSAGMPGWRIVADLTPPELADIRRLAALRRWIVAGLVLVVLLCAGGYVLARRAESAASTTVAAADTRLAALTAEQNRYAGVTRIQNARTAKDRQIAALTAADVDMAALLTQLRTALPRSMSLTLATVSVTGASANGSAGTTSLDTSGRPTVGTISLAGTSRRIVDLAGYVTALGRLPGVVAVVPTTNATTNASAAHWTVTLQLTDRVYVHSGAKPRAGTR